MDDKNIALGEKIRNYRRRLRPKMTQTELAGKVGVHFTTISRWENGESTREMSVGTLEKLAFALKVDPKEFINSRVA